MPSKNSSKKKKNQPNPVPDSTVALEAKPSSSAPKKPCNEIDEIFAGKKRKKPEPPQKDAATAAAAAAKADSVKRKKEREKKENSGFVNSSSRSSRNRTFDGLAIYTEEELGIGKVDAGGTRLCPFDCDCCF